MSGHGCSAWLDTDDIMSDFPVFPEGAEGKTIPILCALRVFHDSGMEEPKRQLIRGELTVRRSTKTQSD